MNKKRKAIWDKTGGLCWYCGCDLPVKGWHADHIEAIVRNHKWDRDKREFVFDGSCERPENDTEANKVPSCASCNIQKGSLTVEGFRAKISGFINSLNSYHTQYVVAKRYGLLQETELTVTFWFERQEA